MNPAKQKNVTINFSPLTLSSSRSRSWKKRGPKYEDVSNYNKPVRWHHRRSLATFLRLPYIPYWLPREVENICSCWVCCHPRLPSVEQQLLRTDFWGIVKYSYKTPEITKHIQQEQFVCISCIDHKASIILWWNVKSLKKIFKESSKNLQRMLSDISQLSLKKERFNRTALSLDSPECSIM